MPAHRAIKAARLFPLDALRGLILVLMALDHAAHFVAQKHSPGEYWGGALPTYKSALAFLTRFVTHLCAPGFFFLMGAGMVLFATSRHRRGWSLWIITGHFLLRGGLLIALQLMVVNRFWEASPGGWVPRVYIGVLFALGGAMILGGLVWWLNSNALLAMSALLLLGTQLLAPDPGQWRHEFSLLTRLLLVPGGDPGLWVTYPVLPWLGLVTFGMAFGYWLADDPRQAFGRGIKLGVVFLLACVGLRALNGFGNIRPRQGDTWIDWLTLVKYPPSLAFMLLTMGVNLSLLTLLNWTKGWLRRILQPLVIFGRVPLFFYLFHLLVYAAMGNLLTPSGTSLPIMGLYWLAGLLLLYPLCYFYECFKRSQPPTSIVRFF